MQNSALQGVIRMAKVDLGREACQRVTLVAEKVRKWFCRGDRFAGGGASYMTPRSRPDAQVHSEGAGRDGDLQAAGQGFEFP